MLQIAQSDTSDQVRWRAFTLSEVAEFFDVPPSTVRSWRQRGMPTDDNEYPLDQIARWRIAAAENKVSSRPPVSAELERYRHYKARLAELDVLERTAKLVSVDQIRQGLFEAAKIIRDAGDKLQRRYGREAHDVLIEAVDDAQAAIDRLFSTL